MEPEKLPFESRSKGHESFYSLTNTDTTAQKQARVRRKHGEMWQRQYHSMDGVYRVARKLLKRWPKLKSNVVVVTKDTYGKIILIIFLAYIAIYRRTSSRSRNQSVRPSFGPQLLSHSLSHSINRSPLASRSRKLPFRLFQVSHFVINFSINQPINHSINRPPLTSRFRELFFRLFQVSHFVLQP